MCHFAELQFNETSAHVHTESHRDTNSCTPFCLEISSVFFLLPQNISIATWLEAWAGFWEILRPVETRMTPEFGGRLFFISV